MSKRAHLDDCASRWYPREELLAYRIRYRTLADIDHEHGRLQEVVEVAAGGAEHHAKVLQGTSRLAFEIALGDDVAVGIGGHATRNEDEVAVSHGVSGEHRLQAGDLYLFTLQHTCKRSYPCAREMLAQHCWIDMLLRHIQIRLDLRLSDAVMLARMKNQDAAQLSMRDAVRDVHRRFGTGVTIVTTATEGVPSGLAVNAFSSLSLDPPYVLICVSSTSQTYQKLFLNDFFAVNILACDQSSIAKTFATSGGDKFKDLGWKPGLNGSPIIGGVSAYLEVQTQARLPAYTHTIFIGSVTQAGAFDNPPLLYLGGDFFDGSELCPVSDGHWP
jgi:flavin reductase (DIM6/NTAB) family NADH-FMN oxidoreductase RutF